MGLFDQIKSDIGKAFSNMGSQELQMISQLKNIKSSLQTAQTYYYNTEDAKNKGEIDNPTYELLKQKYGDEIKENQEKIKRIKVDYDTTKHQTEQRLLKNKGELVLLEKDLDQTMKLYEKGLIPENEYNNKTNYLPAKIKNLHNQIQSDERTILDLERVKGLFEENDYLSTDGNSASIPKSENEEFGEFIESVDDEIDN